MSKASKENTKGLNDEGVQQNNVAGVHIKN